MRSSLTPQRLVATHQHVRAGRFARALSEFQKVYDRTLVTHRILLGELLIRTGDPSSAKAVLRQEVHHRVSAAISARRYECLAEVAKYEGRQSESVVLFQESLRLARNGDSDEQFCRSALGLLVAQGESPNRSALSVLGMEIRRRLESMADPQMHALSHLRFAEIALKSQSAKEARIEIVRGLSSIAKAPNAWLQGNLHLIRSAVAYAEGDLHTWELEARRTIETVPVSGCRYAAVAAHCNLGLSLLVRGAFDQAATELDCAIHLSVPFPRLRAGLLDNKAELALISSDLDTCQGYLDLAQSSYEHLHLNELPWTVFASYTTSVRLHLKRAQHMQASQLCRHILSACEERNETFVQKQACLLEAEAHLGLGDREVATRMLGEAEARWRGVAGIRFEADLERLRGKILLSMGQPGVAFNCLDRAAALLRSSQYTAYVALIESEKAALGMDDGCLCVRQPFDEDAWFHQLNLVDLIRHIASSSDPASLGEEILRLFRITKTTSRAALIVNDTRKVTVLQHDNWQDAGKCLSGSVFGTGSNNNVVRLSLGSIGGSTYELFAEPATAPKLGFLLGSLVTLLRTLIPSLCTPAGILVSSASCRINTICPPDGANDERSLAECVFASASMKKLLHDARKVAATDATVLITGETGTGKDVLAKIIHDCSRRASGPFRPVVCAGTNHSVSSHLFGHKRGAFTDAFEDRQGYIRAADGGTLLLDEVADLPLDVQTMLLRVIDAKEVQPLGETAPVRVNVRFIACTNRNLAVMIRDGQFRRDLYHRLGVVEFDVPPLRSRKEDVEALIGLVLARFSRELGRPIPRLSNHAEDYLLAYDWPGNVRELNNELHRLVVMMEPGECILPDHLSSKIRSHRQTLPGTFALVDIAQTATNAQAQLQHLQIALAFERSNGSVSGAARILGMSRKGLTMRAERLGIRFRG